MEPISIPATAASPIDHGSHRWRTFAIGLGIRLLGCVLIWFGDGHADLVHKGTVVLGVILSIGGIGVLKYLLYSGKPK